MTMSSVLSSRGHRLAGRLVVGLTAGLAAVVALAAAQWSMQPKESKLTFVGEQAGAKFEGDFDKFTARTKMLHNTRRRTQPWKTGLPADFTLQGSTPGKRIAAMTRHALAALTGGPANGHYRPHPDPAQERFFFRLLGECLESGRISAAMLETEIECGHVRADAFDRVRQAQSEPQPARAAVA